MNHSRVKNNQKRLKRAIRVRKHLRGTSVKPRLSVIKSNKHLQVQLIDDDAGKTLCSMSTLNAEFKGTDLGKKSKAAAAKMGEIIADKAISLNIREVIFDRGPSKYHGILAELADAARNRGLQF
ncbi:50S ribosomal protein L18 [Criblamydia sequanensis]|uniref:Large ribosomal subunit protein uL18 n=1 Tax=Candidatus Criblamydia sequanensis CRIB-18 TaxID=1437425 RepID=A0A090D0G7_9BACT|nr:50S ribosomal protein L18 [Criblamydia sequanensis]CDR33068.1 50S ribosomal protein L18 [Criblamydia sequanensis CRIB-18]